MDKQLLEQVQKALQAQQDTIERQRQMLDDKDSLIAQLQKSLEQLAQTQSEELTRLPSLFSELIHSIEQHTCTWKEWQMHRKRHADAQNELAINLKKSSNAQIQLLTLMKEYLSTLVPPDMLTSDTEQLERKLSDLMVTQTEIEQTQEIINVSQQRINDELTILNKLINR